MIRMMPLARRQGECWSLVKKILKGDVRPMAPSWTAAKDKVKVWAQRPESMAPFAYMGGISDRACVPLLRRVVDGTWGHSVLCERCKEWKSRQIVMSAVVDRLQTLGRLQTANAGEAEWAEED